MKPNTKSDTDLLTLKLDVPCQFACPAETNVPEYIDAVKGGEYARTYAVNQARNLFPGSLGRICTRPCEEACRHGYEEYGDPVSICRLKRAGADFKDEVLPLPKKRRGTGRKVAVVGGGPAGLAAARDLLLLGHKVTIFEASDRLGGMLPLAIPEFRLPRSVIEEDIAPILALKPAVRLKKRLGEHVHLDELMEKHDAVMLAVGCQKPYRLGAPGEDVEGVYPGLDFLERIIGGESLPVGEKALVIGGGYTAVDCARTLVRLGVPKVTMAYRRTAREISIDKEEMHHLALENVDIRFLTTAVEFHAGENGKLAKADLVRTLLEDGRVTLMEKSRRSESFDTAVVCIGQGALAKPFIQRDVSRLFRKERLIIQDDTFMSKREGLFGAGDYIHGTRSIIDAIGDGRKAALSIHNYLMKSDAAPAVAIRPAEKSGRSRQDDFLPRTPESTRIGKEKPALKTEVACGYSQDESHQESRRCYLCNLHYEIDIDRCIWCMRCIDEAPVDCIKTVQDLGDMAESGRPYDLGRAWNEIAMIYIDNDRCVRCNKCLEVCPVKCISVSKYQMTDPIFGENV